MLTLSDRAALSQMRLFQSFDRSELATMARYMEAREHASGEVIIWSGSENRSLHLLVAGRAVVTLPVRGEVESVLARLEVGAHFGELTLIDGHPAAGTVTAEERCRVLTIPIEQLHRLRDEQGPLFARLAWAMLTDLAAKLRRTNDKVLDAVLWGLEAAQVDPTG